MRILHQYAAKRLNKPVIKTDVSYKIPALKGFPGPFIKYVNKWLGVEDFLKLMRGKRNRAIIITEYLSYAKPNGKVITFKVASRCRLAEKTLSNRGSTIDKLLIRGGFDVPQNMLRGKTLREMFNSEVAIWHKLGGYIKKLKSRKRA